MLREVISGEFSLKRCWWSRGKGRAVFSLSFEVELAPFLPFLSASISFVSIFSPFDGCAPSFSLDQPSDPGGRRSLYDSIPRPSGWNFWRVVGS